MPSGPEYRQHVLELMRGYRTAQALISCAELGVFEALSGGAAGAQELGERLGAHVPSLTRLLGAGVALGLLEQQDAGYTNSPLAEACLATEGPFYLGNLVKREGAFYRRWSRLSEAVQTGQRPEENVRDEHQVNWVRDFEMALYDVARTAAPVIAELLEPLLPQHVGQPTRVIDIGGGHGAYAVAIARRCPNVDAVVFDLPPVIDVAPGIVAADDLGGRVTFQAGDFKVDPLGANFDVALLFGILVSETAADAVALLRKVHAALGPEGLVAIRGIYLDANGVGPLEATLADLHMLLSTNSGSASTTADVAAWLSMAGFAPPMTVALPAPERSSVLIARKNVA